MSDTPKIFVEQRLPTERNASVDIIPLSNSFTDASLDPSNLKTLYANTEALFICDDDRLAGITTRKLTTEEEFSEVGLAKKNYPTGVAYYRDATDKTRLAQRIKSNDPRYARNQVLLRLLNTVRGIDHAFEQLAEKTIDDPGVSDFYQGLRRALARCYRKLLKDYDKDRLRYSLGEIEKFFNVDLVKFLHISGLDLGINADSDIEAAYEELLLNYRLLAGSIEPAAAVVTKFRDHDPKRVNTEFTETAWPITKKTDSQITALSTMKNGGDSNYHTAQTPSVQLAQHLFADRIVDDSTIMSERLQHTGIAPGVKNAYVTRLDVNFPEDTGPMRYLFARSASLVYMGKGENQDSLKNHTRENIAQIKCAVKKHLGVDPETLHSTVLNTQTAYRDEQRIVNVTRAVFEEEKQACSYVPVNILGTVSEPKLAASIKGHEDLPKSTGRFSKATRAMFAATTAFLASGLGNVFSIFSCASGRDRTGVVYELVNTNCIQDAYGKKGMTLTFQQALKLKMQSLSSPFLATLAAPGSRGLRSESKPGNLFGEHSKQLFISTSRTSKRAAADEFGLRDVVQTPRFFRLERQGEQISFKMCAPEIVLRALQHYVNRAQGFGGWFLQSKALRRHKIQETKNLLSQPDAIKALTLGLLKTKLEALQESIRQKTRAINENSFFKHGTGRLDQTIADCLAYIERNQDLQAQVSLATSPSSSSPR